MGFIESLKDFFKTAEQPKQEEVNPVEEVSVEPEKDIVEEERKEEAPVEPEQEETETATEEDRQ